MKKCVDFSKAQNTIRSYFSLKLSFTLFISYYFILFFNKHVQYTTIISDIKWMCTVLLFNFISTHPTVILIQENTNIVHGALGRRTAVRWRKPKLVNYLLIDWINVMLSAVSLIQGNWPKAMQQPWNLHRPESLLHSLKLYESCQL